MDRPTTLRLKQSMTTAHSLLGLDGHHTLLGAGSRAGRELVAVADALAGERIAGDMQNGR